MDKDYSLLRPFDLEKAKAGDPIVTRDGRMCEYVGHAPRAMENHRVIVQVDGDLIPKHFTVDGVIVKGSNDSVYDLFMLPLCVVEGNEVRTATPIDAMAFALKNCIDVMDRDLKGLAVIQPELNSAKAALEA